jgi:hypothetical protein
MRESGFITDWIEDGIQQGKRLLLIRLLATKFGEIPQSITDQIQGMTADEELDQLGVRLLTADSLEEMGLNGEASR